jgi:hypothetical protein
MRWWRRLQGFYVAESHGWVEDIDWWLTATKKEVSEKSARECAAAIRAMIKD